MTLVLKLQHIIYPFFWDVCCYMFLRNAFPNCAGVVISPVPSVMQPPHSSIFLELELPVSVASVWHFGSALRQVLRYYVVHWVLCVAGELGLEVLVHGAAEQTEGTLHWLPVFTCVVGLWFTCVVGLWFTCVVDLWLTCVVKVVVNAIK